MAPSQSPSSSDHDRDILALALPALGSLAVDPLVSLVDTAFVGRLGAAELGALGINASLFTMAFIVFNFLAYGTTPRVARALSQGDRDEAGRAVTQALILAVVAGVVVLVALQVLAEPLLVLMGAKGPLWEPALTYLRIRVLAGPAVLLFSAARGAFRGYQDTRTNMKVTVLLNLINLALDPLLIFGLGWGIAGAATATVIAQWAGALIMVGLLLGWRRRELGVVLALPYPRQLLPFLSVGWRLLIRTGALVGTMTAATAVAARHGVSDAAAHQIANQLWGFLALAVDALAVAAQALIARHLGEGVEGVARQVGDRLLVWGLGAGLVLGVLLGLLRGPLVTLFTQDPEVTAIAAELLLWVALLQPLGGVVFVWDGIYMGAERFGYLAVAMLLSAALALGLLALVLPMGWGIHGVWGAIALLMVVRLGTLAVPWWQRRAFGPGDEADRGRQAMADEA
ncbi:MAG: MATE family efflux transporter [Myxococcota bacterium]